MKTLKTVSWLHEADMIKAMLSAHDIEVFLPDEATTQALPIYSNAVGGIRILVKDDDFEEALKVIGEEPAIASKYTLACPKCESRDVKLGKLNQRSPIVTALLFGFPLLWIKRNYTCNSCGEAWKQSKL